MHYHCLFHFYQYTHNKLIEKKKKASQVMLIIQQQHLNNTETSLIIKNGSLCIKNYIQGIMLGV
jgi:hypothetical protein